MKRVSRAAILAACLVLFAPWPASAAPGNNGTVKIDGIPFDTHPNNEPHVGCVFQVDFYGYDEGDLHATATFKLHPPTGTSLLLTETVFIGEDPAGGGTDLDAELTIELTQPLLGSGATPHPQQGYHVKLTVNAEGSIGADVKHKVFWVVCEVYPPVPTSAASGSAEAKSTVSGTGNSAKAKALAAQGLWEGERMAAAAFALLLGLIVMATVATPVVRRRVRAER
jgi:hypothetical protein